MNTLVTKLTVTAAIAALISATPVSIDLVRPAAGPQGTAHLALALDTAQARGFGHGGGFRGGAAFHGGLRARFGQRDGTLFRRHRDDGSLGTQEAALVQLIAPQ